MIGNDRDPGGRRAAPSIMAPSTPKPAGCSWLTPAAAAWRSSITTRASTSRRLQGFPEVAGVVADDGQVLVTNRGSASLAWIDARKPRNPAPCSEPATSPTASPSRHAEGLAIAACIGDETHAPELHCIDLRGGKRTSLDLPGQSRWCVMDADAERVFLAIREPSMILVARLPTCRDVQHWTLPVGGAHGLDIDHRDGRLYVACDDAAVVEVDANSGEVTTSGRLPGHRT